MSRPVTDVNLRLLFFAKTRELAGVTEAIFKTKSNIDSLTLLDEICNKYNLNIIKQSIILAVNENYNDISTASLNLKDGDEIALIPPISGG